MYEQNDNTSKEREITRSVQTEIFQLKSTITEMNNSLVVFNSKLKKAV